jgi:hypothetical protein
MLLTAVPDVEILPNLDKFIATKDELSGEKT